jgi:hypothetical protein
MGLFLISKEDIVMSLREAIDKVNAAIESSKKLTTKDRKKMKKGTFCGPNRSFPVPDCKHVGTAKAYLNRSNFSAATKKRIASCINGKAKALGCTPGKPAKAKGAWEDLPEDVRLLAEDPIFATTKELVEASLKLDKEMDLDFTDCEDCE